MPFKVKKKLKRVRNHKKRGAKNFAPRYNHSQKLDLKILSVFF